MVTPLEILESLHLTNLKKNGTNISHETNMNTESFSRIVL